MPFLMGCYLVTTFIMSVLHAFIVGPLLILVMNRTYHVIQHGNVSLDYLKELMKYPEAKTQVQNLIRTRKLTLDMMTWQKRW